ncbi:hypothetical protein PAUR_b0290 [Pseudoalteromonas aurantia 208]|uniref:Orphan protein n=1 Tax=Pseudoalteromonas aurantia 208 TaxID=1314867 RepID=A0ABR9EHS9_9GAMM|nr:hypothetical protein [Pseudoalteromonas aurantia 208]
MKNSTCRQLNCNAKLKVTSGGFRYFSVHLDVFSLKWMASLFVVEFAFIL